MIEDLVGVHNSVELAVSCGDVVQVITAASWLAVWALLASARPCPSQVIQDCQMLVTGTLGARCLRLRTCQRWSTAVHAGGSTVVLQFKADLGDVCLLTLTWSLF